jgi:hypothetical protein
MVGRKKINLLTVTLLMVLSLMMSLASFAQSSGSTSNQKKTAARKTKKKSSVKQTKEITQTDSRRRKLQGDDEEEKERRMRKPQKGDVTSSHKAKIGEQEPIEFNKPKSAKLTKAGTFDGDLRSLPRVKPVLFERPERESPNEEQVFEGDPVEMGAGTSLIPNAAPVPIKNFNGLDLATWGAGRPPDTNGDVGPTYFIQSVNSSIGIYRKSDGVRVAAFTLNNFMSQGSFGNLCDTNNFGDPVVLYDSFEDRWIITDFAFTLDGANNVTSNSFQCFAASKTGDPVAGGWNFYSTVDTDYLGDYPKFGVWTDGIYWTANMFGKPAGASFANPRARAMNKAQMYAGAPTVQVVTFDAPSAEFSILPANARLQTGTPPAGTPNLMSVVWQYTNAISVYKFKVDWNRTSLSTLTGPFLSLAPASWSSAPASVSTPSGSAATNNDTLATRLMMQNQYTNIGGVESLWNTHTVRGSVATQAAIRYYQLDVTGGNVSATTTQAATYSPDTLSRYMPSIAVNRAGDMAMVYNASSGTVNPAIRYAGRLFGDAANTITQTETSLIEGGGYQNTSTRWGDYSTMTLDPDGCTFWMTSEYYATTSGNWMTRIGSFAFPSCVPVGAGGTIQGTVTSSVTGLPISGATVSLGSRTTTTNASGVYSFTAIPAGTYPTETVAATGYNPSSASNLSINDGLTTTQNFVLGTADAASCLTDTTQSDFQTGILSNIDLTTSAGDAALTKPDVVDQQNTAGTTTGTGFGTPAWTGQTFVAGLTGQLAKAEVQVFCNGCGATGPNLTLSIRATSGGLPTGPDLATATFPSDTSGSAVTYSVTFNSPLMVTAGTQYALILRPVSAPAGSGFFWIRSSPTTYANGQRVLSADSGSSWSADATRDYNFKVFVNNGYATAGTLESAVKDSNPVAAGTTSWQTLSWTASTPASTTLRFQAAASNNPNGPFNFVGPGGTAATYFTTSGASLSQFNGLRYLKYKAFLATSNNTVTPTLNDVTVCFKNPRVWTGAVSSDWNNAANWSSSGLPGSGDRAIIPSSGVTNNPTNTTNATVGSLQLDAGIIDTGGNTLTVSDCSPSSVTGGGAASYVKGSLTRCVNNAGTYNFPVGTANGYAPVSLANIAGSGNFNVNPVQSFLPGTTSANSIQRYWGLTPDAGVTQADITFNYLNADVPVTANESLFKFVRRSGGVNTQFTPTSANTATNSFTLAGVNSFSDWSLGLIAAPTAANVSISGRVLSSDGRTLSNAAVTLQPTDGGAVRTTRSNSFGFYRFNDVIVGQSYVVSASAKGQTFSPAVIAVVDNVADFDLTGN